MLRSYDVNLTAYENNGFFFFVLIICNDKSQLSAFLNGKRLPGAGVLHVTEKNMKENKEPQSVSLDCSQAINKKTMVNKINPISSTSWFNELENVRNVSKDKSNEPLKIQENPKIQVNP